MESLSLSTTIDVTLDLASDLDVRASTRHMGDAMIATLASRVGSTAFLLRSLQKLLVEDFSHNIDTGSNERAIKPAGIETVAAIAAQCEIICRTIIANFIKASVRDRKGKQEAKGVEMARLATVIIAKKKATSWLRTRLETSQTQLELVRAKLLVVLQVFNLAKLQVYATHPIKGRFEEEMSLRSLIGDLRRERYRQVCNALCDQKRGDASPPRPRPPPLPPLAKRIVSISPPDHVVAISKPEWPVKGSLSSYNGITNALSPPPSPPRIESAANSHPPPYIKGPLLNNQFVVEKPPIVPLSNEPKDSKSPIKSEHTMTNLAEIKGAHINQDLVKRLITQPDVLSPSALQKQFGKVSSWVKELFGPSSLFFDDKAHPDLDAYIVLGDKKVLKVPFGGRRLKFGMRKVLRVKKETTMDDFSTLPQTLHVAISNAIQAAQIVDSRKRTLICFDVLKVGQELENQHVLLFLSSNGAPLAPVQFKDAIGRSFAIPYFMATTWEDMTAIIDQMFLHLENIGSDVMNGYYDVYGPDGACIPPYCWDGTIKPGMSITMVMWRSDETRSLRFGRAHIRGMSQPAFPRLFAPSMLPGPPRHPLRDMSLPPSHIPPPPPGNPRRPGPGLPIFPRATLPRQGPGPGPGPGPRILKFLGSRRGKECSRHSGSDASDSFDSSDEDSDSSACRKNRKGRFKIDLTREKSEAKLSIGELLMKWTNAPDVDGASATEYSSSSDSGSTSFADD